MVGLERHQEVATHCIRQLSVILIIFQYPSPGVSLCDVAEPGWRNVPVYWLLPCTRTCVSLSTMEDRYLLS